MSATTVTPAQIAIGPPSAPLEVGMFDDLYRMTVEEYERLADAGVLKDRRIELINGLLVKKMTIKPPHVIAVDATREAVGRMLPGGWWIREEKPVRIPDFDEPEPDVSIVRGRRQDYLHRHPGPGEIEFLAEVADSSLTWDRGEKQRAYARANVPVYWIVNIVDRQLEVYTDPRPDGYHECRIFGPADQVSVMIGGIELGRIAVGDLLP
jgi:Uma2 family endonuclease